MIENKSSIPYSYTRHKAKTSKKNNNNSHFQSLNIDFVLSLSFLHLSLKPKRVKCNNESHFLMLKIVFVFRASFDLKKRASNKRLGSNKVVGTFFLIVWYIHMKRKDYQKNHFFYQIQNFGVSLSRNDACWQSDQNTPGASSLPSRITCSRRWFTSQGKNLT